MGQGELKARRLRERLRERCLALPGASEEFPFGDEVSVFKVGGKLFALSHRVGVQAGARSESACLDRPTGMPVRPGFRRAGPDDPVTGHIEFARADR